MSTDLSELAQVLNTSWYTLSNLTIDEQIARFSDSNEYKYTLGPLHPNTCIATVHAYKYDDTCTKISRKGDLLLGFAALECDVPAFNMTIGGTQHESLAVPALRCGEWRAALDGTFSNTDDMPCHPRSEDAFKYKVKWFMGSVRLSQLQLPPCNRRCRTYCTFGESVMVVYTWYGWDCKEYTRQDCTDAIAQTVP